MKKIERVFDGIYGIYEIINHEDTEGHEGKEIKNREHCLVLS